MCVSNLFGGGGGGAPAVSVPEVTTPPPVIDTTQDNAASNAARNKLQKAALAAKGKESTIATSPLGLPNQPAVQKSRLLGGTAPGY